MSYGQSVMPNSSIARVLYFGLQPAVLLAVISLWLSQPTNPALYVGCILAVQLVLGVLEHLYPARTEWRIKGKQKSLSVVMVLLLFMVSGSVGDFYTQVLSPPLEALRENLGIDIWPHQYHICHHSLDLVESNTNFGCAAIVWDRVFGTFSDNRAMAVGSGPIEPSTWHKLIMPIKEYEVSDIAPGASQ